MIMATCAAEFGIVWQSNPTLYAKHGEPPANMRRSVCRNPKIVNGSRKPDFLVLVLIGFAKMLATKKDRGGKMPLPLIPLVAGALFGRATTPKKQAVSKYKTKKGKKVKAYTRRKKVKLL